MFHFANRKALFLCFVASLALGRTYAAVELGIDVLAQNGYAQLAGKRVGLITNQTGIDSHGTRTRVLLKRNCNLVALYTPEHGLDGTEKAGRYVRSRKDPLTGLVAHSLYGPTRKPTAEMLRGVDVLVYDMQDIGCRSYTYISTMGRCMEAAAENHVDFMVLDRPNPLGGLRIEGPSVEPRWVSFVGQFPVPYVHGMTCGELARMINAKGWIAGRCNLAVVPMRGWSRGDTWRATGLRWIPTSPNIPRADSPAYYVATGLIGELRGPETGAGGPHPFEIIAAHGVNAETFTDDMRSHDFEGVTFAPYRSGGVGGSMLRIDPGAPANLTAINVYALAEFNRQLHTNMVTRSPGGKREMFFKVYGSSGIEREVSASGGAALIVAKWNANVSSFRNARQPYLLY